MPGVMGDGLVYENTIHEALGIRQLEAGPEKVVLEMDVEPRVHQPLGLLHGGASAVLAESAASIGGSLAAAPEDAYVVGVDLNITHLRAKRSGAVRATATPIRKGRTVQVWGIDVSGEDGKQVAVARCTLAVKKYGSEDS